MLAKSAIEISPQHTFKKCVDVLAPEVRGGPFCWSATGCEDHSALAQEHRAWVHIGASPHDVDQEKHAAALTDSLKQIADLEAEHGSADPATWRWGPGTACVNAFAAYKAKYKYWDLKAKVSALQQLSEAASGSARDRSRSPRTSTQ